MSRTHHHSAKWGHGHLFQIMPHSYYCNTPSWWTRLFMNRPRRMQDRATLRRIAQGRLDPDNTSHSLGCHKPHKYYW